MAEVGSVFHVEIFAASFVPHSYALTEEEVPSVKAACPNRNEHDNGPSCFRILIDGSHNSVKPTEIPRAARDVWSVNTKSLGMDLQKVRPSKINEAQQSFTLMTVEECLVWKTKSPRSNH